MEREFKALLNTPLKGEVAVSTDPMAQRMAEGERGDESWYFY